MSTEKNLIIRCFTGGLLTEQRSVTKRNSQFTHFNYSSVSTCAIDHSQFLTNYKTLRKHIKLCYIYQLFKNMNTQDIFATSFVKESKPQLAQSKMTTVAVGPDTSSFKDWLHNRAIRRKANICIMTDL